MHYGGDPFQTHAGIDIRFGEKGAFAVFILVKLGEDQIPDFGIALAIAARFAIRLTATVFLPQVIMDFSAGTARSGITGRTPEVILFTQTYDFIFGDTRFAPDVKGFIVITENRYP